MTRQRNAGGSLALERFEQHNLRILLHRLELAKSEIRNYLIRLLDDRQLDQQIWGVAPDLTHFTEIPQAPPDSGAIPSSGAAAGSPTAASAA